MRVWIATKAPEPTIFAARELARVLSKELKEEVAVAHAPAQGKHEVALGAAGATMSAERPPPEGGFVIARRAETIVVAGASAGAVLHGAYRLLEQLGARLSLDGRFIAPRFDGPFPWNVSAERFEPAFARRAFVSDIMTYHYEEPERFARHLDEDRRFIAWMAWRGINRFFYIRHARDSRVRIDELAPALHERGIGAEYGGHILQLLLERARFSRTPDYFPLAPDGRRNAHGNLCVSNPRAIRTVCQNAMSCVRDYPENRLFHVWGADVWQGAWCACPACAGLSPQLQYMAVVNAIAQSVARLNDRLEVAYLAYHDTIEPDLKLKPASNVCFEWAPRERCYCHAIDDARCATNRRYWDALRRYVDLFRGRGHVFEYYADALLFGGLGFATPSVIAADLRAYRKAGLSSISCLTFGAYSVLAYPVNLIAFAANAREPALRSAHAGPEAAAERHPRCAREMTAAHRSIAAASRLVLSYGDLFRVDKISEKLALRRQRALRAAAQHVEHAVHAAQRAGASGHTPLQRAEIALWRYGAGTLRALAAYLSALNLRPAQRDSHARKALDTLDHAFTHIRRIRSAAKGVWGETDLEAFHRLWLNALRRRIERSQ